MRARTIAIVGVSAALTACADGHVGARNGSGAPGTSPEGAPTECATSRNDEVRLLLAPTCEGCHRVGSNKPFFASLRSFEDLLVYDDKLVVPGKPDEGRLVQLLEGKGTGQFTQMPPPASFATLAAQGNTEISIEAIRAWITDLPPEPAENALPDPSAPTMRRASADEMLASLLAQLGLDMETDLAPLGDGALVPVSPDALGGLGIGAWARFVQLGGAATLRGSPKLSEYTPAALQLWTSLSQAWCSIAVSKPSSALLSEATLADTSATAQEAIKNNIRYLTLRLLGMEATDDDVEAMYQDVYLAYEKQDTTTAWTAVCAAFVRRPEWLFL